MQEYESYLKTIELSFEKLKGELYKFSHDGEKKSATTSRKLLVNIMKSSKELRKLILVARNKMPRRKRNVSPDRWREISEKRQATMRAKKKKE